MAPIRFALEAINISFALSTFSFSASSELMIKRVPSHLLDNICADHITPWSQGGKTIMSNLLFTLSIN